MSALWRCFLILKKQDRELWGIPYQGSKTKLVEKIARFFPNADHFYDLFGGGFSVSHYMIKMRRKSYKHFHYNELRSGMCELIQDAIAGKYNYDVFKPEWIDRERFMREKESNPYIKILWSFGNNGKDYFFGKDREGPVKSMHMAVVFDEFDEFMFKTFGIKQWPNKLTITGKRLYLKRLIGLRQLEQLQQLERLQQLQQLQQLDFTNKDYKNVLIYDNSVIYCDIPYFGTADYGSTFSHKEFFDWADVQTNPVFISEYNIADNRFTVIKEFSYRTTFSAGKNDSVVEKLYLNKTAMNVLNSFRKEKSK